MGSPKVPAARSGAARRIGLGLLVGFTVGALAGLGEVARLVWFVPGSSLPPIVVLDAVLIDGGLGALVGVAFAAVLLAVSRVRRRSGPHRARDAGEPSSTRRAFLKTSALTVGSLGLLSAVPTTAVVAQRSRSTAQVAATPAQVQAQMAGDSGPSPAGPNVLFVTIDTLRADQLGCYGHPFVSTPALDGLAKQGARFALHTVQQPQTNPSHASMFTGMYPSSSGIRIHMVDKLPNNLDSMATLFQKAGYATAGLYSWMSFNPEYSNFQRGFQVYRNLASGPSALSSNADVKQVAAQVRTAEEYLAVPKTLIQATGYKQAVENDAKGRADVTTDGAIAQLRAFGSSPFFLWVHYFDPHYPFQPPGSYASMYDPDYTGPVTTNIQTVYDIEQGKLHPTDTDVKYLMALYQGEISFLDSQLSRLFGALDDLGLTSNTVVVVTGDHGEGFGEHADLEENGNFFHPHSLYGTEQAVPLIVRYPGRITPGTVVSAPSQAVDLLPTLLDYAGLPIPAQVQGTSLVPLLDGRDPGTTRVAYSAMPDYVFTSLTWQSWKIIRNNAAGQFRLFNLATDPGERTDLSQAQPDVAARLSGQLSSWMKAVKIS